MLPLRARVDLGAMAIKRDTSLHIALALFSVISKAPVGGVLPLSREAVGGFYSESRLENNRQIDRIAKDAESPSLSDVM